MGSLNPLATRRTTLPPLPFLSTAISPSHAWVRRNHDKNASAMIYRRPIRYALAALAILSLWWSFRSQLTVVVPHFKSCLTTATPPEPRARVAKVTVAVNALNATVIYDALQTHKVQNDLHGYTHYISTTELVGDLMENDSQKRPRGAWSKPAYLLAIIVAELTKPESERLQWVLYVDEMAEILLVKRGLMYGTVGSTQTPSS